MKTFSIFAMLSAITLLSCTQKVRYTQQSPEIDLYKKNVAAYENQNWEEMAGYYADTAKVLNNATEANAHTVAQFMEENKRDATLFTSWKYDPKETEYEMVVTDKGETWVNFWGVWQGTLKANGKLYEIPSFFTARFVDGKIVKELGYFDTSKLLFDISKLERSSAIVNDTITPN